MAPLRHGANGRYRARAHDLDTDEVLDPPWQIAPNGSVVIVDGLFLHRDELVELWDRTVFLDVPLAISTRRMAVRDGTTSDPRDPMMRRYVEAHRSYVERCAPRERASIVVDNSDFDQPQIIRVGSG